jgi:choline-sulfatase
VKARYYGKVTLVDEMVGRVLGRLAELGLSDRTIVVFTSEHGELMGAHRLMFKSLMYEESAGVPLILSVPGLTDGGRRVRAPVSTVDLTPTLLDLMGQPLPRGLQGGSWVPTLRGGGAWPEGPVFMEFNGPPWPFDDRFTERLRTVRTPEGWKLTVDDRSQGELYDLVRDPQERKNLFYDQAHLERVRALLEQIRVWQRRNGDEPMRFDEAEWRRNGQRLRQGARAGGA